MIIRNFLFHRVSDEKDAMWPPMTPALFSKIIQQLVKNYTVVPLEHFLNDPDSYKNTKKIATVLFDDGYKDNIEVAAPLLQKHKCAASFYIVTDCIDRNIPTWTYLIDNIFQVTQKDTLELPYNFVPEKFKKILFKTNGKVNPVIKEIKPWMKKLSNPSRLMITQCLLDQCNDVPLPANKMMSWNDIREMEHSGFVIGSHSHTHPMLASLKNENEIEEELKISAQRILEETGKFPETISYPIGSFDERVTKISVKQGYKFGLAVEQKYFNYPSAIMAIPRVELYEQPWWKVQLHIQGNYWNKLRTLIK